MVERSTTSIDHKEIGETFNRIDEEIERIRVGLDEGIARIKAGLEGMMVVLENRARREELKIVAIAKCQSTFDHEEELECLKVLDPINGHESSTKALPATIVNHPHFEYYGKVQFFLILVSLIFFFSILVGQKQLELKDKLCCEIPQLSWLILNSLIFLMSAQKTLQ